MVASVIGVALLCRLWQASTPAKIRRLLKAHHPDSAKALSAVLNVIDRARLDCLLLAGRFTLLDRTGAAEVMPKCLAAGTEVVIGGVFNSGILATGAVPGAHFDYRPASTDIIARVNAMETEVKRQGTTLPAAAMRFVLDHPAVASVLIGSAKASSLLRNATLFGDAQAMDWPAFNTLAVF